MLMDPKPTPTSTERKLERLYGKPIASLLAETVTRCGSVKAAAKELDVTVKTFTTWMGKWGVEVQRTTVVAVPPTEPS
jgi:molybdenum-dependent DNA-binding transcriptional regulator ModE